MSTVRLRHLKESQGLQGWHENVKIATANAPDLVSRHGRFVEPRPVPRKQSTPSSCLPQKRSLHIRKSLENCIQLCPTSWRTCKGPKLFLLAVARRQVPRIGQFDIVTCSMWVACAGSRCTSNTTTNNGEDSISHQADALETPTTSWHHSDATLNIFTALFLSRCLVDTPPAAGPPCFGDKQLLSTVQIDRSFPRQVQEILVVTSMAQKDARLRISQSCPQLRNFKARKVFWFCKIKDAREKTAASSDNLVCSSIHYGT